MHNIIDNGRCLVVERSNAKAVPLSIFGFKPDKKNVYQYDSTKSNLFLVGRK